MKTNLLIIGTKNFNNSLDEIKEDLGFSLIYYDLKKSSQNLTFSFSAVIVDGQTCKERDISGFINKITDKPILLLDDQNLSVKWRCTKKIFLPISIIELKSKIINLITTYKFNKNSSVKVKDYILDKNEKKLKKKDLSIDITEREVDLIELLFREKKPFSKIEILKKVWKYADDADTHTVETHIYRLRKKILNKFQDESFIINSKKGYGL